jgi:hypothetical protein
MGGLALSFWKHVRHTQDVDLLIDLETLGLDAILEVLRHAGVRIKHKTPVIDLGSVRIVQLLYEPKDAFMDVPIDLLLAESSFQREALKRRIPAQLAEMNLDFYALSCEDILIMKMEAGRLIDRADAANLVRLNRNELDLPYLLKWVSALNLTREWAEVWREAIPGESDPIIS